MILTTEDYVQSRWFAVARSLGVDQAVATGVLARLEAAYGGPHRHYHTLTHIAAVIAGFERLGGVFADPDAALLALLFHDAIYDPARHDNEAMSADLLHVCLDGHADPAILDRAAAMIRATQSHRLSDDADTNFVLDLDMAILGAPWDDYRRYAEGVYHEYLPVYGHEAYAAGRAKLFLEPTLGYDRIFLTAGFAGREAQARANLTAELDLWRTGGFPAAANGV